MKVARYVMLLAVALWIGGIFFFSIGVAPVAFHIMQSEQAGEIVRGSLRVLHLLGLACGAIFLCISFLHEEAMRIAQALVLAMMLLTAFSQWWITPRIEELRRTRDIHSERFSRLHQASTGAEGAILVMGFVALFGIAAESRRS